MTNTANTANKPKPQRPVFLVKGDLRIVLDIQSQDAHNGLFLGIAYFTDGTDDVREYVLPLGELDIWEKSGIVNLPDNLDLWDYADLYHERENVLMAEQKYLTYDKEALLAHLDLISKFFAVR